MRNATTNLRNSVGAGRSFVAERFIRPAQEFVGTEALGGIILLAAAVFAVAWANSPWQDSYFDLWAATFRFDSSLITLHMDLHEAVNDGLMTVFFFVVGLEIKRELLHGELASLRRAALPTAAAIGGMIVPALIYTVANGGGEGAKGWGIPMATDIAFAMGALALLGRRVPFSLKVFLLALAIVDDLGAIIVIAVFYTESISLEALAWGAVVLCAILLAARAGVRSVDFYVLLGVLFWLAMFKSGIHATLAGVVLAALTPARPHLRETSFATAAAGLLARFRREETSGDDEGGADAIRQFERLTRDSESPLERLEQQLHPWTSFLVVPLFAVANAGIAVSSDLVREAAGSPITLGVAFGLVLGKPIGIFLFSWLAVRAGIASLPRDVSFVHILGAGLVAGIGFTVSLFIAGLAFPTNGLADEAKIGILAASLVAGIAGYIYLWIAPGEPDAMDEQGDGPSLAAG